MRAISLPHSGFLRTFSLRRGLALLSATSLGVTLVSAGSTVRAQETRPSFHAQKGFRAKLDGTSGLYIATYQTPEGKILVYLPHDLQAGESVVSTMRLQPRGKDDSVRAACLTALASYHFRWGKTAQAVQEPPLTWTLPGEATEADSLTLTDAQDHPLAQTDLPVAAPLLVSSADAGRAANVQTPGGIGDSKSLLSASNTPWPRRGVVGHPIVLQASVGTDALTYQVLVGDKPARLLAASPRSLIVESPDGVLGKTTLHIQKNEQMVAESAFQNDRVTRRTNPWPYVIGAGLVIGIVGAVLINQVNHDIAHGVGSGFQNFHF
jgi:hypothetical protein